MKNAITLTVILMFFAVQARSQDMERMKRDIEVAENILATLVEEGYSESLEGAVALGGRSEVEGSYLEGFGVLFTLSAGAPLGHIRWKYAAPPKPPTPPNPPKPPSPEKGEKEKGKYKYQGNDLTIVVPDVEVRRLDREELFLLSDSLSGESFFRSVAERFFTDYAYLMRQVPEGEKIMIRSGGKPMVFSGSGIAMIAAGGRSSSTYSAAVTVADLAAHQKGRLSREQLIERIKYTSDRDGSGRQDREMELLSSVFSRLYQPDLSEAFYLLGNPSYERIEGLGAVFSLQMGSEFQVHRHFSTRQLWRLQRDGAFSYTFPEPDEEEEEEEPEPEESAEKADEAYPDFLDDLKKNVVEYGSIAKGLEAGEALIFRIRFFTCDDCETVPGQLEISAPQSVLEGYRDGRFGLEEAAGRLKVTEVK